ncbi:aromatic ring-opening dioxygenase catalytic subunit (LigB family) [Bradyrhizobium sp. LM6.10]
MTRFPTLFLSHGGGPWPFMEDRRVQYAKTAEAFGRLPQLLPASPKAVLVITGHWEAETFTVTHLGASADGVRLSRLSRAHLSPQISGTGQA